MFCVCEQCTSRRSLFLTAGGRGYARSSAPWLRWGAVCQQLNTQHHGGFYFGDTQRLHWTAVLLLLLQSHQPASAAASAPFNFFSRTPAAHTSSMRCVPWSGLTQHQPQLVSPLPLSSHSLRRESSAVQHPRIGQRPVSTAAPPLEGQPPPPPELLPSGRVPPTRPQSLQQTRTISRHDGPNRLGFVVKSGAPPTQRGSPAWACRSCRKTLCRLETWCRTGRRTRRRLCDDARQTLETLVLLLLLLPRPPF